MNPATLFQIFQYTLGSYIWEYESLSFCAVKDLIAMVVTLMRMTSGTPSSGMSGRCSQLFKKFKLIKQKNSVFPVA